MLSRKALVIIVVAILILSSVVVVYYFFYYGGGQQPPTIIPKPIPVSDYWSNPDGNYHRNRRIYTPFTEVPYQSVITFGYPIYDTSPIVSGDFDGDGYYEFAFYQGSKIMIIGYRGWERVIGLDDVTDFVVSARLEDTDYVQLVATAGNILYVISNSSMKSYEMPSGYVKDVVSADIDNDSFDEVLIGIDTKLVVFDDSKFETLKDFGEDIEYISFGDMGGDAIPEIVVATSNNIYVLDGSTVKFSLSISTYLAPMTGDVNGDGIDELVVCDFDYLYIIDYSGKILAQHELDVQGYSMGDMDGDGSLEVYVYSAGNLYRVTTDSADRFVSGISAIPIFADFGNDSHDEAITIIGDQLAIIFYNGTTRFVYPREFPSISSKIYATDLDNDNLPEIIVYQQYWGAPKIFVYSLRPKIQLELIDNPATINRYEIAKYHNYSEIMAIIDGLINDYPSMIQKTLIGYSYDVDGQEDLPIYAVKITNGDGKEKPALLVVAAHHARELITAEAALYLIVYLVEQYGKDPLITQILDNFDVYVVPVLNVGGHDYALFFDPLRRNLHPVDEDFDGVADEDPPEDLNGDGLIDMYFSYTTGVFWGYEGYDDDGDGRPSEDPPGGVDLNRNYNYSWTNIGDYGDPSSSVYSGEYPLSEPETEALSKFMNETRPILAISLHSGEESLFFPWGTGYKIPIDYGLITGAVYYAQLATGFAAMQSCSIYEAAGAWDDDAFGYYGIIPFTPEIFGNDSWPQYGVTQDSLGNNVYYIRGIKWMFNPFPRAILDVNIKVLNLFVSISQFALNIISDDTPPILEGYNIITINGTKYLVVRAYDAESGIHYIKATLDEKTYYLIYNKDLDAWTLKLNYTPNQITITVYNRAGLSTQS